MSARRLDHSFVGPSPPVSLHYGPVFYSKLSAYLTNGGLRSIGPINKDAASSIVGLLSRRGPSAIFPTVGSVIVDSVEAFVFRGFPHVSKKSGEGISPFVANRYPSPSISVVSGVFLVIAALLHLAPNAIFSCFILSACAAMMLALKTAATFCYPSRESAPENKGFFPAITPAIPAHKDATMRALTKDNKFAKTLASQIMFFHTHHYTGAFP